MSDYLNIDPEYRSPIIDKMEEDIAKDLFMDEMTVKDKLYTLAGRKHFWTGVYARKKYELTQIENKRANLVVQAIELLRKNSPVSDVSDTQLAKRASNSNVIRALDEKLKEGAVILQFLEMTNKTFSEQMYITKQVVELMKMEQT